jgi:hypothetical protein
MSKPVQTPQKWKLEAWPEGPKRVTVDGKPKLTRLFHRDYAGEGSALRAATQIRRRYPDARIELTRFEQQAIFWMARENYVIRFCPNCDRRLLPQDEAQYICMGCGDEWHEDHFKTTDGQA